MTSTVVFLVKNGIGFGHLRRAMVLAEALQASDSGIRAVIVAQASSTALLERAAVQVVNFPLLQRLPNEIVEDWYIDVLDELLRRLDPVVVVEDTYPDPRYTRLPSIADRPRVLVLRRLDGLSFDTIRTAGRFAHYDRILIAQDQQAFEREGHSGDTLTAVQVSGRFSFVGPIYHSPDRAKAEELRQALAPPGTGLIVVSGGAGGDQMPDGYGDRLFSACDTVAARLHADGTRARFVLVTGPYYAGRPIRERRYLTVRTFEPLLPELLAAADVAVIKPGHNAVCEALSGTGRLILVPDVSFMEGLDRHSARVVADYDGHVASANADVLETLIQGALRQPVRTRRIEPPDHAISTVVTVLRQLAVDRRPVTIPPRTLFLILRPPPTVPPQCLRDLLPSALTGAAIVGDDVSRLTLIEEGKVPPTPAIVVDTAPNRIDSGALVSAGTRLVIGQPGDAALRRWLATPTPGPSLLATTTSTVIAHADRPDLLHRHLRSRTTAQVPSVVTVVLADLSQRRQLTIYLTELAAWLARQPLRLATVAELTATLARSLLEPQ